MPSRGDSNTDTGQYQYPSHSTALTTAPARMMRLNGLEFSKRNRQAPQSDVDLTPYLVRRFTNVSVTDVQLINGLQYKTGTGKRWGYRGTGYLWTVQPRIPGQTRDNAAGFHRRGPSVYNVQDVFANGPGSQPEHPGGPGKIAAPTFINPMTGLADA